MDNVIYVDFVKEQKLRLLRRAVVNFDKAILNEKDSLKLQATIIARASVIRKIRQTENPVIPSVAPFSGLY